MHDRRIDGTATTFGNASSLFMNAMTWYDHETRSIWSQPWGRALEGDLEGVELFLLPSQVITWKSWRAQHPDTLLMIDDLDYAQRRFPRRPDTDFLIGLLWDEQAKAYPFPDVAAAGAVNDAFAGVPVLVWAQEDVYHAYLRQVAGQTLTFRWQDEQLVDEETSSTWDVTRGIATAGPLQGQALRPVPSFTSWRRPWQDFYPNAPIYQADE